MMNGEAYSSYPSEGEMLLMEGQTVRILGYEKNVVVKNKHESLKSYFAKKVVVFYMYLDYWTNKESIDSYEKKMNSKNLKADYFSL